MRTIVVCLFLLACSNKQANVSTNSVAAGRGIDSMDQEESEPDYRKEYIATYTEKYLVDTSFKQEGKLFRIVLNHFCTMDSGLIIPAKYNWDIQTDFVTHNFESELTLLEDVDTVFQRQIVKSDFDAILHQELRQYAILQAPRIELIRDSILVHYSISIPVTDVGIAVKIKFDKTGNFLIEK